MKIKLLLFCLFTSTTLHSQETKSVKENIYILFDHYKGDVKRNFNAASLIFSLHDHEKVHQDSMHRLDYFIFDSLKQKKENVSFKDFTEKLISGEEAIKKVDEYLQKYKNRIFKTPYYYNRYFNHIYIYEKISEDTGVLYEVEWKWGIH